MHRAQRLVKWHNLQQYRGSLLASQCSAPLGACCPPPCAIRLRQENLLQSSLASRGSAICSRKHTGHCSVSPCCTHHSFCQSHTEYVEKELDNYTAKEKLSFASGVVFFSGIHFTIEFLGSVTLPSTSMLQTAQDWRHFLLVYSAPWEQINHKTINHKKGGWHMVVCAQRPQNPLLKMGSHYVCP